MYYCSMVKVFGHISPDTDTIGSAILWAWYMKTHTAQDAVPFALGKLNKETSFVLERWGISEPEILSSLEKGDEVIVVDTTNPQELLPDIAHANIIKIIDHHKLGGLETNGPIEVTIRPVACTATIIYDLMGEAVHNLPKEISGLILSCILSDTLEFRSPTTTSHDKDVAEILAKKLGLNITKYASEMFAAKSDVSDYTDIGLIHLDSKKYLVGDKNIRLSSLETTDPKSILDRKQGIIKAIKAVLEEEKDTDDVLLFVIDILKEEATVLTYNQFTKDLIYTSFGVRPDGDTHVLPGVLSRKKQIIPVLKLPE